jgi:hypothetical protein
MVALPDFVTRVGALRARRSLGFAAALVLLLGTLAGAIHRHHGHEETRHPCVVCSLHNAPSTPAIVVVLAPPAPTIEVRPIASIAIPRSLAVSTCPARAPPFA